MDKKLILITTIAIVVYLISLNYETIKTKLLNFKALILGRNPTLPPVITTLPPKKITQIKTVACRDAYTCSSGQPSSIVDEDLNTIFKPYLHDGNASGEKIPGSLLFTFNNIVTINSIIWHSVGNPFWDVDWVEIYNGESTYTGNRSIQTFIIPQLDIPEDRDINNNLGVNSREYFDRQIILKLNKPYIGKTITIRFKNSKMSRMTAVREIEFFT